MKKLFNGIKKINKPAAFFVKAILLLLSILNYQPSTAQSPVRSLTILKPPYSTSLSDYYTNSDERLRLQLTNTDIRQPVIRARLQLHIISNKVTLRNRPFVGPIIELEAGVPNFLSGMDLAVYFNPANIEILSGLDYNALFQKPRLPDGTYTFRFDVIDANTGQLLSDIYYPQPSINIISNDPPFLNLPRKGDNIRYTDPLNIVFNWTPRAVIKGVTDYQFSLYEINDNGMPPENVPFMSQPIYQTTINTTTFLYGATEPPLLPGKKYAWRIQALAKQGIDSYSLYNNDGYTETFWFKLQDNCDPPQQISAVVKGGAVTLEWLNNPAMFKYIVEYRKKGNDFNRWFNTETNNTKVIITDVAVGNSYEYRVGGICTVGAGATYSDIRAFTIPPRDTSRNKTCGILPNINITNKNKLEILPIGANVMVGDYPATILSVTPNGGGSFSGTAAVRMNIFNIAETPVKAKFDNVAFNTDYKLIDGFMVTTYDKTESQIVDVDTIIRDVKILIQQIDDFLNGYKGTEKNKEQAAAYHKQIDSITNQLLSSNITDETKRLLQQCQQAATSSWTGLENATPCNNPNSTSNGPNHFYNEIDYDCYKPAVEKQTNAIAKANHESIDYLKNNTEMYAEEDGGGGNNKDTLPKLIAAIRDGVCKDADAQSSINAKPQTTLGKDFFNGITTAWRMKYQIKLPQIYTDEQAEKIRKNEDVFNISDMPDKIFKDEWWTMVASASSLEGDQASIEEAKRFVDAFLTNTQPCSKVYGKVTVQKMLKEPQTIKLWKDLAEAFKQKLKEKNYVVDNSFWLPVNERSKGGQIEIPTYGVANPVLYTLVGGMQRVELYLTKYENKSDSVHAELLLSIKDDFGVSEDDYIKIPENLKGKVIYEVARPSLLAFWILQHQRGYKPFQSVHNIKIFTNWKK